MLFDTRDKLNGITDFNKSLHELAKFLHPDFVFVGLQKIGDGTLNTKLVVKDEGSEKSIFYNRLNLDLLLKDLRLVNSELDLIIKELNIIGFDLINSDLVQIEGGFETSPTSLGYFGFIEVDQNNPLSVANLIAWRNNMTNQVKLEWDATIVGNFIQTVKKKIEDGEWLDASLYPASNSGGTYAWEVVDTDIIYEVDTQVYYRVDITNGAFVSTGNEVSLLIPGTPVAVNNLVATIEETP